MPAIPQQSDKSIERLFRIEFDTIADPADVKGLKTDLLQNGRPPDVLLPVQIAYSSCEAYIDALPVMLRNARDATASAILDPTQFVDAQALKAAASALANQILPVSVGYAGNAANKRYACEGVYSGDGGPFGDWTEASDEQEAEFIFRWTMAENAGYSISEHGAKTFANVMSKQNVQTVFPEPVSGPELKKSFLALIREALSEGHSGPALDAAIETARMLGEEIELPAPRM